MASADLSLSGIEELYWLWTRAHRATGILLGVVPATHPALAPNQCAEATCGEILSETLKIHASWAPVIHHSQMMGRVAVSRR